MFEGVWTLMEVNTMRRYLRKLMASDVGETILEEQAVFAVGIPPEQGSLLERVHRGNPGVSLWTFWREGGSILDTAHGGWGLGCLPPQLTYQIYLS